MEKAEKERKLLLLFCFVPTQRVIENSKKIAKKFKKIKKSHFGVILSQISAENNEKERK